MRRIKGYPYQDILAKHIPSTLAAPLRIYFCLLLATLLLSGCGDGELSATDGDSRLKVVTTTTMITDLVREIGGDSIRVQGLMGSGVDPHLYKASEGDVSKLTSADVVFYNGLHLEGKLEDVFERMGTRTTTVALAETLPKGDLISSENFASNYDPHVWFAITYWKRMANYLTEELTKLDPPAADYYQQNRDRYLRSLDQLAGELSSTISTLPEDNRVLITAHDAFNYFGREFGFEVIGLQGLSTATEAGVRDVQDLARTIIDRQVKAIFIESSVPRRTIEALQAAVKAEGFNVQIGGTLYSDALGDAGTPEGTYAGMYRHNVNTIVGALK